MYTKKIILAIASLLLISLTTYIGIFYYQNLRGSWAAWQKAEQTNNTTTPITNKQTGTDNGQPKNETPNTTAKNNTGLPLTLPPGSEIDVLTNVPGARVLAIDSLGNLWVSQTKQGQITLIEIKDGKGISQTAILKGLRNPHGLAFDPEDPFILYFAEEHQISKVRVYSEGEPQKIIDLPADGGHFTRTIGFGPDKRLYVSIGSSCNVCMEEDARRSAIYYMEKDGSDFKQYAKGLRNSVFFTWKDGNMWATEMGRDLLGDELPPDEINIVENEKNYGWPICYGQNIHDTRFDKNTYIRNPCMNPFETPSLYDLPAHSAPLGLAFIPNSSWPKNINGDLLVAFHGSWNRTTPTGYKIVKLKIDYSGDRPRVTKMEDFISGWLSAGNKTYGRPVDILALPNGTIYISDDKSGKIYSVKPQ